MQTRTYAELFVMIEGLCGVKFAGAEIYRINALINRRATRAYRASDYWPRFLKIGEERTVTDDTISITQDGLSTIDTFLRIHRTKPFVSASAQEFAFMVTDAGATLIAGSLAPASAFVTYKATHDDIYGSTSMDVTAIPKEWFQYMAHGTYADYLRSEGQQEKAALADAEAADILTDELLRIDAQQTTQIVATRIRTNRNMQSV